MALQYWKGVKESRVAINLSLFSLDTMGTPLEPCLCCDPENGMHSIFSGSFLRISFFQHP